MLKTNVKVKINNDALRKTLNNAISKASFNIKCPNCQFTFPISGSQFGNTTTCPNCKVTIMLNNDQLKQDINNISKFL